RRAGLLVCGTQPTDLAPSTAAPLASDGPMAGEHCHAQAAHAKLDRKALHRLCARDREAVCACGPWTQAPFAGMTGRPAACWSRRPTCSPAFNKSLSAGARSFAIDVVRLGEYQVPAIIRERGRKPAAG